MKRERSKFETWARLAILVSIIALIINAFYSAQTSKLSEQIGERDAVIDSMIATGPQRDALALKYEKIDEYIEGCEIIIDGKSIKYSDLVSELSQTIKERDKLEEQVTLLNEYIANTLNLQILKLINEGSTRKDSLYHLRNIISYIKRDYGIEYKVDTSDNSDVRYIIYTHNFNRADTALLAYAYFDGKIYKVASDSAKVGYEKWTIEINQHKIIETMYVSERELKKIRKNQEPVKKK